MKPERMILTLAIAAGMVLGGTLYFGRHSILAEIAAWRPEVAAVPAGTADSATPLRTIQPRGIGDRLPDFRLAALDGSYLESSHYQGRLLLVNFWATWCDPCRSELPLLQRLWDRHQDDGLMVIAPAMDDPDAVRRFVEQFKIGFAVAIGGEDIELTNLALGNVDGVLPYSVLVAPDGMIVDRHIGQLKQAVLDRWIADHLPHAVELPAGGK